MAKRIKEAFRILSARETLIQDDPPPREPRLSFAGWLFQPEKLSPPAVSVPPAKTSFFRWLVVPDKLPLPEVGEGERRKSLLTELMAREELPRDPVPVREKKSLRKKKSRRTKDIGK